MDAKLVTVLSAVLVVLAILFFLPHLLPLSRNRLPPGPRPVPIFGNALQLPKKQEWLSFAEWGRQHGDIMSITVFGQRIIILNSQKTNIELLDHRSAIYSNRPHLVMANELMGWGKAVVMLPYGERFKASRKLLKIGLSSSATKGYWSLMERETVNFLEQLLITPDKFVKHVRRTAGAIALKIAYDYDGSTDNGKLVATTEKALHMFALAALPGVFVVDTLPFLKYVPSWMPFAKFRKMGLETQNLVRAMIDDPFNMVKQQVSNGTARHSFTSSLLQIPDDELSDDEVIKWVAGGLYSGQADTTVAAMSNFFLAMMLYPDCQRKAQDEIDGVVGHDRLPTIADRISLPYVDNVLKEVLRWHPVVPMVSHSVMQDDTYRSFYIPSGTPLVANIWASLHDEAVYSLPQEFRPQRFFPPENAPDSFQSAFGFGRRVCPGILVAHASLFCAVASTLAVFNIKKALDDQGNPIEPELVYSSGVVSHPKPFKCLIQPRSDLAVELIHRHASEKE